MPLVCVEPERSSEPVSITCTSASGAPDRSVTVMVAVTGAAAAGAVGRGFVCPVTVTGRANTRGSVAISASFISSSYFSSKEEVVGPEPKPDRRNGQRCQRDGNANARMRPPVDVDAHRRGLIHDDDVGDATHDNQIPGKRGG